MSNDNGKVHTVHIALANMASMSASTKTSTTSGLESIANTLVALQSLQQEQVQKVDEKETAAAVTTTTPTVVDIPLPTMSLATRVVSTETIGDNHSVDEHFSSNTSNSCFPPLPPRVEERETISKAKISTSSPPSTDRNISSFFCYPSPSRSPPSSNTTSKDIPPSDFSRILSDPEAWLRKTENLFGKLPPTERSSSSSVIDVQPNDVLCGRGGETNHHPGNVRYRSLVKAYQKLYLLAKRRDKPKIAQCIVVSVRGVDGRFLKRMKNANKTGVPNWVDVGNVKAREKTSQALREGAPDLRDNATIPTTKTSSDNAAIDGRQLPALDRRGNATVPPTTTTTTTLSSTMPTALEAMMGWRMSTASFNSAKSTRNANGSTSPVPPTSSSSPSTKSSIPPSDTDTDTLTAQAFTVAAAQLMQHPIFHKLDPGQQQQAILHELKVAKASASAAVTTAEMATRTSAATVMPANIHGQGRTSPLMTTTSMQQQQHLPHSQHQHQQRYPPHEHPYYHHGQYHHYPHPYARYPHDGNINNNKDPANTDTTTAPAPSLPSSNVPPPQTVGSIDLQSMYRDLLRAKAALASGGCNVIDADYDNGNGDDEKRVATDTTIAPLRMTKKRSAPCNDEKSVAAFTEFLHTMKNRSAPFSSASSLVAAAPLFSATFSLSMESPTVVSDAGSEVSSSLSSITKKIASVSSFNASNNNINNNVIMTNKDAVVTEVSRGGSRLKRLKLRMRDETS